MKIIANLILVFTILCSGCGYTTRAYIYPENSIHIPPAKNEINIATEGRKYSSYQSFPVLIENRLTNKVIQKFNTKSDLKVVKSDINALRLDLVVTNYTKEALVYTDSDDVKEQRLRLSVALTLTDPSEEVLKKKTVVGESSFSLTGPNAKSESAAQVDLVDDTARRILEVVVEEW